MLLLIGVGGIDGVPRQLNELVQVFIHHHSLGSGLRIPS
jgi:hypothetical protein